MRVAWVLIATAGCRSILGIDTPSASSAADAPPSSDARLVADAMPDAPLPDAPPGAPTVVQGASKDQMSAKSLDVTFDAPVASGDLIVVAFGVFTSNGTTFAVTDSLATTFVEAVPPTSTGGYTATMWYGFAAGSGSDTVTAAFGTTVDDPDVRIAEYHGVSQIGAVDVQTGNTGQSETPSATLTTQAANDLLVAASYGPIDVTGPGSGFDQRALSTPQADILEDRIAIAPGSYTATAEAHENAPWVMQLVAFRP